MKVLYLNHTLKDQGSYFRAFDIARQMAKRGHQGTLLTASPNRNVLAHEETIQGVRVVETPSWNPVAGRGDGWGPLDMAYRMGKVMVNRFDLVYAFAPSPNVYLPTRFAQVLRRKPMVVDWCDSYNNRVSAMREEVRTHLNAKGTRSALARAADAILGRMEKKMVRKAGGVTVVSRELERAARFEGVPESNVLHLPQGTNLSERKLQDKNKCREILRNEKNGWVVRGTGPFLGFAGDRFPDGNNFLTALAGIFRRYPSARLLAKCPAPDMVKLDRFGLTERIAFFEDAPGAREEILFGASDVLLFPVEDTMANRTGWPEKFSDYLSAGRPIATNAIGEVTEYFPAKNKVAAWLEAPPNEEFHIEDAQEEGKEVDSLAQTAKMNRSEVAGVPRPLPIGLAVSNSPLEYERAVHGLLAHPEKWVKMGASARQTAESRLDWGAMSGKIERFLKQFV